jgi:hypothetical protein
MMLRPVKPFTSRSGSTTPYGAPRADMPAVLIMCEEENEAGRRYVANSAAKGCVGSGPISSSAGEVEANDEQVLDDATVPKDKGKLVERMPDAKAIPYDDTASVLRMLHSTTPHYPWTRPRLERARSYVIGELLHLASQSEVS